MSAFGLPLDMRPMEAKLAPELPVEDGPWRYEPKWDGFRCLAFRQGDAVELRAKSGKPLGRYFPEVVAKLRSIEADRFVVDGELVIETAGRTSFDRLQMRLHPAASRITSLSEQTPARLVLFDMLMQPDGEILMDKPLDERRAALAGFVAALPGSDVALSPSTDSLSTAKAWLADAGEGKGDGVAAKRATDPYLAGQRAMVKVKRLRTADCVVGGFRYLAERREVGSLLLGLHDDEGKLHHVGFTSTIANKERPALTKKLEALRKPPGFTGKAPGGVSRWSTERSGQWEPLQPKLVVEVRFDHVTGQRFRHGVTLLRWRPDKAPGQCTFEQIA